MLSSIFYAIGVTTVAAIAYRVYCFIHLYFIHQSTLPRYLHGKSNAYALVTGASDGIGYATAKALQKRGFNIILHGRNPEKLLGLSKKMNEEFPNQRVVIAAGDATETLPSIEKIAQVVEEVESSGGKLTVLVNNIGGGAAFVPSAYTPFAEMEPKLAHKLLDFNATFPTLLTRALLPRLIANGPSLILNHSSYAGVYHMPFITVYSAAKAFNVSFSASLSSEMKVTGADVEVLGIVIGAVKTPGNPEELSLSVLPAEELAEGILGKVGCGKRVVTGAFRHAVFGDLVGLFPEKVTEAIMNKEMVSRAEKDKKAS